MKSVCSKITLHANRLIIFFTLQTTAAIKGFLGDAIIHASHEKHIATSSEQFFHCDM